MMDVPIQFSSNTTGYYKQGQRVFVYETEDVWAWITNMQPDEWVQLEALHFEIDCCPCRGSNH